MSRAAVNPATAIDLFSGAGGATCGLRRAGFDVRAAIEVDERAVSNYALNHPHTSVIKEDIRTVDPGDLLAKARLGVGDVTLLKSCPPCQAFSSRGRRDADDERNDLVLDVFRFVAGLRPAVILLENVRQLAGDWRLDALVRRCRSTGYSVAFRVLDAAQFGVPQHRSRLVLVGLRKDARSITATQWFESLPLLDSSEYHSAVDALRAVNHRSSDSAAKWRSSGNIVARRIRSVPSGGGRDDLPDDLKLDCHTRLDAGGPRQATEAYGRIRLTGPAPTMTTRCTTVSCGRFIHPTQDRGLSLREAATLQSFPLSYKFEGYYDQIERQIGNALPPLMAEAVGRQVLEAIETADT